MILKWTVTAVHVLLIIVDIAFSVSSQNEVLPSNLIIESKMDYVQITDSKMSRNSLLI